MKLSKITLKKIRAAVTVMMVVLLIPVFMIGCSGKKKLSQEVNEGTVKFMNIFDTHKKDNYSEVTSKELDDYVAFVNSHKDKGTAEENEVINKLQDVMTAYSSDSSEVAKKGKPSYLDPKEKELKDLLQKYSDNK